jgi:hypothetical protein
MSQQSHRKGFSLVELQVAFVVFAIGVAGLCPLVVMQSKHLKKIEGRFSHETTYYLKPSNDSWARKLGARATLLLDDPGSPSSGPVMVIDDGDSGFTTTGDAWEESSLAESFQGDHHHAEAGDGSEIATWQFAGLAAGWYDVRVTWHEDEEQASDAPFSVFDGATEKGAVAVNQQEAPLGDVYEDRTWLSLGVFAISGDVLKVQLTNAGDGKCVADGIRLVAVRNDVSITSLEKSMTGETATAHVSVTVEVP